MITASNVFTENEIQMIYYEDMAPRIIFFFSDVRRQLTHRYCEFRTLFHLRVVKLICRQFCMRQCEYHHH